MDDLFGASNTEETGVDPGAPLAARMRPRSLEEYLGQQHILGTRQIASPGDRVGPADFNYPLRAARQRKNKLGANHRFHDKKSL